METANFILNIVNVLVIWLYLLNKKSRYYEFRIDKKHLEVWKFTRPVGEVPNSGTCLVRVRVFI